MKVGLEGLENGFPREDGDDGANGGIIGGIKGEVKGAGGKNGLAMKGGMKGPDLLIPGDPP